MAILSGEDLKGLSHFLTNVQMLSSRVGARFTQPRDHSLADPCNKLNQRGESGELIGPVVYVQSYD